MKMFTVEFTGEAIADLASFPKFDQQIVVDAIQVHLTHQASETARNRKQLRPNPLSQWELRVKNYRVFYDVDTESKVVKIKAVGVKRGSKLLVHGEEFEL